MIGKIFIKDNYDQQDYAETAQWCNENKAAIIDKGGCYEVVALPEPSLDERKARAVQLAQTAFAAKRDSIRWVNGYGFDCAPEDITNFMAAYTPLLVAGEGSSQYKVWLTETTKGIVTLTLDEMTAVYQTVRTSQLEAYAWYEQLRTAIDGAETAEALAALLAAEGLTETTP